MFDQCLIANSSVSWSSSAWDCTEAWEVVSLFVIPFSLTQFFKIILKIQKRHRYKPEVVCQAILLQAGPSLQAPHGGQLRSGHLDWLREQCPRYVWQKCKMLFLRKLIIPFGEEQMISFLWFLTWNRGEKCLFSVHCFSQLLENEKKNFF